MTDRLPTDFDRYQHARRQPWVRAARAVVTAVTGHDPLPPAELAEAFGRSYYDGDPLADAFIADLPALGGFGRGRALLELALEKGIDGVPDAPDTLVALFRQLDTEPAWLDWSKVERGAQVYRRLGVAAISLDIGGQMQGYPDQVGIQPVLLSGTYRRDMHARLIDTARYHIQASEPGALANVYPAPEGRAISVRVRILHAFIRARVSAHEQWNHREWGVPISQAEMMGPMLGQSGGTALGATFAGHLSTASERDALLHFWRYNGYLMGCNPDWFPTTDAQARQCASFYFLRRSYNAIDECAELVRRVPAAFESAPGASPRRRLRDTLHRHSQIGWMALAFGPFLYPKFGAPNPLPGLALNLAQFPLNACLSLLAWTRTGAALVDRHQRRRRDRWYAMEKGSTTATYAPASVGRAAA